MGFNIKTTELLIRSQKLKIDFTSIATLGRQTLNGSFVEFQRLFKRLDFDQKHISEIISRENRYSESFLKALGAKEIVTFDASDYEGASQVWDMNLPIADVFKERYSLMIDSGSLEHIFNFPQALKNCMEMVKLDGHMIGITPANNFFGHGFYQFSPELFFRVFTQSNGFELVKMWLFFPESSSSIYEVKDPLEVQNRVSLMNSKETFLFYVAKRIEIKDVFAIAPQQSDYEHQVWKSKPGDEKSKKVRGRLPSFLVPFILSLLRVWKNLRSVSNPLGTANQDYFKKVKF
ncbi:hypothetical protein [Algoriphagus aquimarinus]|uniref:Methyltransferase domain-containing protein n=1 Tax=Algoriphagus aquimarinus TaxID=237018 RepID=A0A1I1CH59_9BACT|nr:hypothetical protein [Algoriphagus aquimarinus]SFB60010.1 hypothetical protein SAMN04489723_12817 [Algoriphagus aquimarinus]